MSSGRVRVATAAAAGLFLTAWFGENLVRWIQTMGLAMCLGSDDSIACRLRLGLFVLFVYPWPFVAYAVLWLLAATGVGVLLARPPGEPSRPDAVTLGALLMLVGCAFRLVTLLLQFALHDAPNVKVSTPLALDAILLAPLLIALGAIAAVLLWRMRKAGWMLAVAFLALNLAFVARNTLQYPGWPALSPVGAVAQLLYLAFLAYLLRPAVRRRFTRARG